MSTAETAVINEMEDKMPKRRTKIRIFACKQCGHNWVPRISNPPLCPSCHSPYWKRPSTTKRRKTKK